MPSLSQTVPHTLSLAVEALGDSDVRWRYFPKGLCQETPVAAPFE